MRYLLDTNILSELRKSHAHPHVTAWFRSIDITRCHISVVTLGEIRRGIEKRQLRDERYVEVFEAWLARLEQDFADRIWPFDKKAADRWGRLAVHYPAHLVDAQIAATASVNGAIVVTRNVKDFRNWEIPLLNPFEAAH